MFFNVGEQYGRVWISCVDCMDSYGPNIVWHKTTTCEGEMDPEDLAKECCGERATRLDCEHYKKFNVKFTVMVKVYRGSGRPSSFHVVSSKWHDEIERLKGHGFTVVESTNKVCTEDQAWDRYTYRDFDGFTQWKPLNLR